MKLITENLATWTTAPNGIKKLRELILELAVRGLLVPQDASDEPAGALLKKIAEEKTRLQTEGKIKKSAPLPKISESEKPFVLPDGWEWVKLRDVLALITDGDHQPPSKSNSGIPFLVISNLNTGKIDFNNCRFVTEEYFNNLDWNKKPSKNDILYTVIYGYGFLWYSNYC